MGSMMVKRELSDGIIQYVFEPLPGKHFWNSITAIINGQEVLLIDTAYEQQALLLYDDLNSNGLDIKKIIISHFQDDHMQGLKALPKVPVYGSLYYQTTLDLWTESKEHHYFIPTELIKEEYSLNFGEHCIKLIPFPGHSPCTIISMIDQSYIHIADELMFSVDGKPLLPSTDPGCIERHIASLERLKNFSSYTLIPSHGPEICGKIKIEGEINNRISYFKAILNSKGRISYDEAIKDCDCEFLHSEWHDNVYD